MNGPFQSGRLTLDSYAHAFFLACAVLFTFFVVTGPDVLSLAR